MRTSTARTAANVAGRTNVAALTNHVAAQDFSAIVIPFSAADLAKAAKRTKAAAKGWKDGSRCPDTPSMINMARTLPSVRDLVISWIDDGLPAARANSVDAITAALRQLAKSDGAEGQAIRALLREAGGA